MDDVYLLLRNNQQSGPFGLKELVQQDLKYNDLIWVEGKSFGWTSPVEHQELKPYIAKKAAEQPATGAHHKPDTSLPAAGKHIFVSLPARRQSLPVLETTTANTFEQQAEALRKKVEAYAQQHQPARSKENNAPVYAPKTISDLEKEYTAWLHKQTQKKKERLYKRTGITAFVVLLILSGGYLLAKDKLVNKEIAAGLTVKHTLNSEAAQMAKDEIRANHRNRTIPSADTLSSTDSTAVMLHSPSATIVKNNNRNKKPAAAVKIPVPQPANIESNEVSLLPPLVTTRKKVTAVDKKDQTNTVIITKESNTLGSKINRFFKKLKHKNADKQATTDAGAKADIMLTSFTNNTSGKQSLKLALYNPADETIKEAVVELRYYNNSNDIIEKRLVHFKNIAPNDTAKVTVASNPLTDHVYYRLLSADD